jgi:hypothetical protein
MRFTPAAELARKMIRNWWAEFKQQSQYRKTETTD